MSDKKIVLNKINELKKQLKEWEYHYYAFDKPLVDDYTYDNALKELIKLETQYPEFITDDSPSKRVGGTVSEKFEKVLHKFPMLSLSNVFNDAEVIKFDNNIKSSLKQGTNYSYSLEPKIDGLSISLIYSKGKLIRALTRGDGKFGEDITNNAKTIKSIPLSINELSDYFEVRGEVFLTYKNFNKINQGFSDESDQFSNPRNAAAGSLRNLDSSLTAKRNLDMIAYYIPSTEYLKTHKITKQSEILSHLKKIGFHVSKLNKVFNDIKDVVKYLNEMNDIKDSLEYPIDGMVIKLNEMDYYDYLGYTSKFPKWATAYKFPPEIAKTKLFDIIPTVGRTGKVTYVAKLQPVKLGGSVISSATLHNYDYIDKNDIRIGDVVEIYKAGEIIPKVLRSLKNERKQELKKYVALDTCPYCHTKLEKLRGEVDQYCVNTNCPERIVQSIVHFCSKDAMNIEELSLKTITKLYENKLINSIQDIFLLETKKEIIINSNLQIKEKSFNKIISNITNSKKNSLEHLIFALGIRHVGERTSLLLSQKFNTIDQLMSCSKEQLETLNDIGSVVANSIYEYFKNDANIKLINDLKGFGLNMTYIPISSNVNQDSEYYKKNFCITGSFDIPRQSIKKLLMQKFNANVTSTINNSTDYLIVGENCSSKLDKAKQLGIKIIQKKIWE